MAALFVPPFLTRIFLKRGSLDSGVSVAVQMNLMEIDRSRLDNLPKSL